MNLKTVVLQSCCPLFPQTRRYQFSVYSQIIFLTSHLSHFSSVDYLQEMFVSEWCLIQESVRRGGGQSIGSCCFLLVQRLQILKLKIGVGCSEMSSSQKLQRSTVIVLDIVSLFQVSSNI